MTQASKLPPGVKPLPLEPIVPVAPNQRQPLSRDQAMALAFRFQSSGELDKATNILKQVINSQANYTPALHLLGVIKHQQGNLDEAIGLTSKAANLESDNGHYHANLAEMYRLAGNLDKAVEHGQLAVKYSPDSVSAHSNLGIAYYDRGDFESALDCQNRALQLDPNFAPALNNLGSIQREQKDKEAAIITYRRVLAIQPQHVEAMNNLGAVLTEEDQYDEAVKTLVNVLRIKPDYPDAHSNLGNAFLAMEETDKAMAAFRNAIALRPGFVEAHQGLARVLQEKDKLEEAYEAVNKALKLAPEKPELFCLLAGIQGDMGFPEQALATYDRALALDSELTRAYIGKGTLLMEIGQLEESEQCQLKALELDSDSLTARVALTQVRKARQGDENLAELARRAEDIDSLYRTKAMALHFALGKSYDDIGDYDRAFPHFLEGCRIKRSNLNYSSADTEKHVDELINFFTSENFQKLSGNGVDSKLPIFILGMPRSGTTLTEQIIASHPMVHGAGELPDMLNIANGMNSSDGSSHYPEKLLELSCPEIKAMGQLYIDNLLQRNSEAQRITDKMPANFFAVGLIRVLLPQAKIIHVRRNPIDTCISGFSKMYNRGQFYSYDLTELGHYYRQYARLMEHWRSVMPSETFYELQYEELVADNEDQARKLLEFCGLDWSDDCLSFHKTERSIRTASVTQVRQPIYKTSVERWRRYEAHLQPLLEALGSELVAN